MLRIVKWYAICKNKSVRRCSDTIVTQQHENTSRLLLLFTALLFASRSVNYYYTSYGKGFIIHQITGKLVTCCKVTYQKLF